jgi:hypothetical protein
MLRLDIRDVVRRLRIKIGVNGWLLGLGRGTSMRTCYDHIQCRNHQRRRTFCIDHADCCYNIYLYTIPTTFQKPQYRAFRCRGELVLLDRDRSTVHIYFVRDCASFQQATLLHTSGSNHSNLTQIVLLF